VPFTGSHPAAVLPFLRTPLPASALVLGSMAPDLPYYLPVPFPWATHTAVAVVTVDLLLGGLAWALWHGVLAAPALAGAPVPLRDRVAGAVPLGLVARLSSVRRVALLLAALAVGAATHVLWDEFTHPRRWGTAHIPALAEGWGLLPGYRWLQYASGLAGALVLLAWLLRWWRRTPVVPAGPAAHRWGWPTIVGVAAAVGAAGALRAPSPGAAGFAGATWGGGAAVVTALLLALSWHVTRRTGTPESPRST
jgi:Domain of unknown function (DUF4184)